MPDRTSCKGLPVRSAAPPLRLGSRGPESTRPRSPHMLRARLEMARNARPRSGEVCAGDAALLVGGGAIGYRHQDQVGSGNERSVRPPPGRGPLGGWLTGGLVDHLHPWRCTSRPVGGRGRDPGRRSLRTRTVPCPMPSRPGPDCRSSPSGPVTMSAVAGSQSCRTGVADHRAGRRALDRAPGSESGGPGDVGVRDERAKR